MAPGPPARNDAVEDDTFNLLQTDVQASQPEIALLQLTCLPRYLR